MGGVLRKEQNYPDGPLRGIKPVQGSGLAVSFLLFLTAQLWPQSATTAATQPGLPHCTFCRASQTGVRELPAFHSSESPGPERTSQADPVGDIQADSIPSPSDGAAETKARVDELPSAPQPAADLFATLPSFGGLRFQDRSESSGESENPQTRKKRADSNSATSGSPGHIFWIVPAFKVNYGGHFTPLTPKEKFQEWAQGAYDPLGLTTTAVQAGTLEYSSPDGFCGYGTGFGNYSKCFGSMELDANDSSFLGDFVFTVWWRQDPRYFRLGKGGFCKRGLYTISRVFVTYNDSGKNVFYSSALAGTGIAAVLSNLYYPQQDRTVGHTMSRAAIDIGDTALYNGAAEFWPDIHHWLQRRF